MKHLGYSEHHHASTISPYLPDFMADNLADIDFGALKRMGIKHVLLDLDQTLRRAYSRELEQEVIELFQDLRTKKMFKSISIVTNNSRTLAKFSQPIGVHTFQPYWRSKRLIRKPSRHFFEKVLKELGAKPEQTIMIGDKLRSDIIGGNRAGLRTLLVKPRGPDYWFDIILLSRWREKRHYRRALEAKEKHSSAKEN